MLKGIRLVGKYDAGPGLIRTVSLKRLLSVNFGGFRFTESIAFNVS